MTGAAVLPIATAADPHADTVGAMAADQLIPRGHYLAGEAGRLAGVSGTKIGQWARRGHVRSSQDAAPPRVYAYQDIAEAMIVHELLLRGVKHAEILGTIEQLRTRYGTEWPLAEAELAITLPRDDGTKRKGSAWLLAREDERYVRPSTSMDQGVLAVDVVQVAKDLERGGWIVRDLPGLQHIEVNPDRLSGRPTIRGRRIAAEDVARTALDDRDGRETLREGYDLTDEEIEDAVTWWTQVLQFEPA